MNSNELKALLSKVLQISAESISEQAEIYRTRNWDSLAQLQIVLELEKVTSRSIPDEEIDRLTSFNSILLQINKDHEQYP